MLGINDKLRKRESEGKPIKVGMAGAAFIGKGMAAQLSVMHGMDLAAIADHNLAQAEEAFGLFGISREGIILTDQVGKAQDAITRGKKVITASYELLAQLQALDVVVDTTTSPRIGARVGLACVKAGKDIVTLNIEADVTCGRILSRLAQRARIIYTVSSGDEPGAIKELYDFVDGLGMIVVAAGKGKNNPLDREANPDTVASEAAKDDMDPAHVASFFDGTKTMIEMATAANGTGLYPEVRGMHGPQATVATLSQVFCLKQEGGILTNRGVVDYSLGGDIAPGVFVIGYTENKHIRRDLAYLKFGKGPNYAFCRPYHLWFIEAPLSVARAVIDREKVIISLDEPAAEVVAVAKKDLSPGEMLDGIGGFTTYGIIDRANDAKDGGLLPIGLAEGARVLRSVGKGGMITYKDVELPENEAVVILRRLQDLETGR